MLSRERVLGEFEASVRDPEASLPELSSLERLCTTTSEGEQGHVRDRLAEYDVAHFCFGEQRFARDGSPAPTTSFYISDVQVEWARDHLADFFRGGSSVLLARAANDFESSIYRGALDSRDIGYTTSRLTRQYPIMIGTETLFFVAEVDEEAARRAIEDAGNAEAPTIGVQEAVVSDDESRSDQDLRDERHDRLTRLLLFLWAIIDLVVGAVYLGTTVPILFLGAVGAWRSILGSLCLFFAAALVALGRWSRRNPEPAFGWSLVLLILNVVAIGPAFLFGGLFTLIGILATVFSWRRARERRLEGSSKPAGD